jgi:GT2 family glycosyltransferase
MLASTSVSSKIILFFVKKKKKFLKYISNNIYIIQMFFFFKRKNFIRKSTFYFRTKEGQKGKNVLQIKKKSAPPSLHKNPK